MEIRVAMDQSSSRTARETVEAGLTRTRGKRFAAMMALMIQGAAGLTVRSLSVLRPVPMARSGWAITF